MILKKYLFHDKLPSPKNIPWSEYYALYSIYNSTSGSNWEFYASSVLLRSVNLNRWHFPNFSLSANATMWPNPCVEQWHGLFLNFVVYTYMIKNNMICVYNIVV
jgi:hypothetical protein